MKNSILLLILLTITIKGNSCIAQVFQIGSIWQYDQIVIGPPKDKYSVLRINKDTIIFDKTYFLITSSYQTYKSYFLIRQDSLRIFLWSEKKKKEFLLYDFSLNIGDTSHTYTEFLNEEILKYRVDSISVDSYFKKKVFHVSMIESSGIYFSRIIEGLGDETWFFPTLGFVDPPPGGRLLCYGDKDVILPVNSGCLIKSMDYNKTEFKLQPNPSFDQIRIMGGENLNYKIIDSNGRVVKYGILTNENISINELSPGIYVVELVKKVKPIYLKFIKN